MKPLRAELLDHLLGECVLPQPRLPEVVQRQPELFGQQCVEAPWQVLFVLADDQLASQHGLREQEAVESAGREAFGQQLAAVSWVHADAVGPHLVVKDGSFAFHEARPDSLNRFTGADQRQEVSVAFSAGAKHSLVDVTRKAFGF